MDKVLFFEDVSNLETHLTEVLKHYSSTFVLVDENTEAHCLPLLKNVFTTAPIIEIKSGEQNKNIASCDSIWAALTHHAADRKALLVNLGGGVICDMGGFAATCYKRGIDFINIPTTLLAMVDASVGGKTGIDFMGFKNQIGVFSEAKKVLVYDGFLKTLDQRQLLSGMAEVIKHYLIADAGAFHNVENFGINISNDLIKKAIEIKHQIVSQDPFEKNIRKKLNFGHTVGHALESCSLSTTAPLLHGEAVAYGMAIETTISANKNLLPAAKTNIILNKLSQFFSFEALSADMIEGILVNVLQDKKNENGAVKMALVDDIGSCIIDVTVTADEIKTAIGVFNQSLKAPIV